MQENPTTPLPGLSRRDFMRVSGAATAAFTLAGAAATLAGCSRDAASAQGFRVLRQQDLPLLGCLLPAALAGALPADGEARSAAAAQLVKSFDQLMWDTSPGVRTLFLQLLDLLNLGVTRGPLFGQWASWESAGEAEGSALLERLAGSRVGFLRGAYNGLATMAMMAWYLEPANQSVTRYPGPPRKIVS
jgi:hypothetical protein